VIKLACMSLSYQRAFRAGSMDVLGFVDACRALDLDGVDLNARSFPTEDEAYLKQVKLRCIRLGLPIACVSIANNFGRPEPDLPAQVAMTKRWIDHALLLGAPQVRVFAGSTPPGDDDAAAWARASRCLKEVADYGYDRGVLVSLQNHNHGALTKYGADVLRFLEEAGPHLGHVWDTGQYVGSPGASGADSSLGAQEVLYQSLQQTVHLATHVRTKFYRIDSGVEEWLDYPRILAMLRAAKYNGFLSIVYEGKSDEAAAVQKAVRYLRSLLASS